MIPAPEEDVGQWGVSGIDDMPWRQTNMWPKFGLYTKCHQHIMPKITRYFMILDLKMLNFGPKHQIFHDFGVKNAHFWHHYVLQHVHKFQQWYFMGKSYHIHNHNNIFWEILSYIQTQRYILGCPVIYTISIPQYASKMPIFGYKWYIAIYCINVWWAWHCQEVRIVRIEDT